MKRERCFLITQRRKLDFFPICCLSFSSERCCSRNINLCRRNDWSSQEVPKGQSLHLAEDTKPWQEQVPPKSASPLLNPQHENFLFSPLCSEQCPSTEKTVQIQILIFPFHHHACPKFTFFQQKNGRWTTEGQGPFQCHNSMFPQQHTEHRTPAT